jgi:hypothetical protein
MSASNNQVNEFGSGDVVEPGEYIDIETGAKIHVHERDELPVGRKVIQYTRRFRRVDNCANGSVCESAA